jgi:hypothetical protein
MELSADSLKRLFLSSNRVVETVQSVPGLAPLRGFRLLFPLWQICIAGRQYEKRPYEVVERFLERAIAEAGLCTAAELSRFFGLPPAAVAKTLAFLRAVGHVTDDGERLSLTPLGLQSLQSQVFLRPLESLRLLYCDAFDSQPLPRIYYQYEELILTEEAAMDLSKQASQVKCLYSPLPFNSGPFYNLVRSKDREQYNLPSELEPGQEAIKQVVHAYFPLTVVEAHTVGRQGTAAPQKRYLVLSPIPGQRDTFFEQLIQSRPALAYSFPELDEDRLLEAIKRHASRQGVQLPTEAEISRSPTGLWRLIFSARLFRGVEERRPVGLSELGNYRQEDGYFFQLWCPDEGIRRQSALEQTILFMEREERRKRHVFRGPIVQFMQHVSKRLEIAKPDWQELKAFARNQGREDLLEEVETEAP